MNFRRDKKETESKEHYRLETLETLVVCNNLVQKDYMTEDKSQPSSTY